MNKQTILSLLGIALVVLFCIGAHAQGPQAANVFTVCPTENCTVTAISSPSAVLQFGAGTSWLTLTSPKLPLTASCTNGCSPQIGTDPASGMPKSLVAVEQAQPFTVTLGDGTVVTVPALPDAKAPVDCALPASSTTPAAVPDSPANCKLLPGATAIATDGQMVAMQQAFAPYYLQYCQGAVCNAPQVGAISWLVVGPDTLGGPTGGTGVGTLYLIPAIPGFKLIVSNAPAKTVTLPALVTARAQ